MNTNRAFRNWIETHLVPLMEVRPLMRIRDKVIGVMAESGRYRVELDGWRYEVADYGHYSTLDEPRHWSLKMVNGCDAYWHLHEMGGEVFFSPTGTFRNSAANVSDWVLTPLKLNA